MSDQSADEKDSGQTSPDSQDPETSGLGFTVKDRRGEEKPSTEEGPDSRLGEAAESPTEPLSTVDFMTFLISLGTSAMVHLGDAQTPDGSEEKNLPLAKQTIDMIEMLREKTRGNLDGDEEKLLSQLLYDLRLRYVAATSQ